MKETQISAEPADPTREAAQQASKPAAGQQEISARAKRLAKRTAKDWGDRDVTTYASSIAFYFFMSMIPLLIIILQTSKK